MRIAVTSFILLCAACSSAPAPVGDCSSRNCLGCCDAQGQCKGGIENAACGSGGFRCTDCGAGKRCSPMSTCEIDPNAPLGGGSATGGGGGATGGGVAAPGPLEAEYVMAHNVARQRATPAPSPPLPPVSWDATVADFARLGSERCIFAHRSQNQYGENLFASAGEATPTEVVEAWEREKHDYTLATNRCTAVCGHYTQVVWRSSVRIGCSTTRCTINSPLGNNRMSPWYLTACNYAPPGNYVGQKPY